MTPADPGPRGPTPAEYGGPLLPPPQTPQTPAQLPVRFCPRPEPKEQLSFSGEQSVSSSHALRRAELVKWVTSPHLQPSSEDSPLRRRPATRIDGTRPLPWNRLSMVADWGGGSILSAAGHRRSGATHFAPGLEMGPSGQNSHLDQLGQRTRVNRTRPLTGKTHGYGSCFRSRPHPGVLCLLTQRRFSGTPSRRWIGRRRGGRRAPHRTPPPARTTWSGA